jgi:hypothetical protein
VPNELNQETLKHLAKLGARARLEQIELERKAILAAFPDLHGRRPAGKPTARVSDATRASAQAAPRRRTRRMTAAQRKEVSDRMKKYWAERRKAKG